MVVRLTKRDERLLAKCLTARWLTTSQIQRLFFTEVTGDAVRKRLRKLARTGYLHSSRPHQMAQALHTIGPKGQAVLEGRGVEVELRRILPKQLEHFIGINDIRIAVESSAANVVYFFAAWELGKLGWRYTVVPDGIFALENRRTFLAEYDRGYEPVETVGRKLATYAQGLDGFPFDAVLIAADQPGRLESLRRHLRKRYIFEKRFLGLLLAELREATILSPLFMDLCSLSSEKRSLQDY